MYTLEERMKAVELYIQSGFSEGAVIHTLGYPSYTALRYWYKEYLLNGEFMKPALPSHAIQKRRRLRQSRTTQLIKLLWYKYAVHWVIQPVMY